MGPICLCLSKPFCQGTVFWGKSVFCCRFAFCCRLLSLALISLDLSCSSVFLVGLWALFFIGFSSVWAFGHGFKKWASTPSLRENQIHSIWLHFKLQSSTVISFSSFLCGLVVSTFTLLRQIILFLSVNS